LLYLVHMELKAGFMRCLMGIENICVNIY
jgi:hypothetical protein